MIRTLLVIVVLGVLGWFFLLDFIPVQHPHGKVAPHIPLQTAPPKTQSWMHKGYTITPYAGFMMEGRVIARKYYGGAKRGDLIPYDFAMGWGVMSDSAVLEKMSISQFMRYYRYHWSEYIPASAKQIANSSANMHMIPANDNIESTMSRVRKGDVIVFKGMLVGTSKSGETFNSSTTREDTGNNACEVIWVENLYIRDRPPIMSSLMQ